MISLILALALAGEPQAVVAEATAAHPLTEGVKSQWVVTPSGSQMADVYPKAAMRQRLKGGARLSCLVEKNGSLSDCRVIEETPAGMGFGEAALKLSKVVRMKQVDAAGKPTFGASVVVPMQWTPPR